MTFREYPISDWTGISKARLSVRIHISTRRSVVPERHDAYGAVMTVPGEIVHLVADTAPLRSDSDHARHFMCLLPVMTEWINEVRDRHVDVLTTDTSVLSVFQRHARGGRTGRQEVDIALSELAAFCTANRVTLTVRMQPVVADEEEMALRMLADHLASDQCTFPLARRERRFAGPGWRCDIALAVRNIFGTRLNPPTGKKSFFARDLDIPAFEIDRRLADADVFGDTNGIVRFVPYFSHVMDKLSGPPSGRSDVRVQVTVAGGVCVMTWGPHGWTASAWPDHTVHGDGGSEVVTCPADIERMAVGADPLLSPWMHDIRSILDAARIAAMGAAACGRRLGCHGRPADLCGWIETVGAMDERPVFVLADMSVSIGSASGSNGMIGVGYVVVGPLEVLAGYCPFPFDGAVERKSGLESFASVYALAQAPRTAGGRRRYILVTDCLQWFANVSRILVGRPEGLTEGTGHNVQQFMDAGPNVVDVLWVKGHSNSLDPFSVGNAFCDRLARAARRGLCKGEHVHPKHDWISSVFSDVSAVEDATGEHPLSANLEDVMIADMLGRDLDDIRRMVRENLDLRGLYGGIPWDEIVVLPAAILYGTDRSTRPEPTWAS